MTGATLSAAVAKILEKDPSLGRDSIAKMLGVNPNGELRGVITKLKAGLPAHRPKAADPVSPSIPSEQSEFNDRTAVVSTCRRNVRTLEELLDYMKVDLDVWEVERHVINKWEVGAKPDGTNSLKSNTDSGFAVEPLYQVKAWLVKKKPSTLQSGMESVIERIAKLAKPAKPIRQPSGKTGRFALEISLFDAHFGLLAWGKETGENYDLKIAERRYAMAVDDLLTKTRGCQPEVIVFPLGNDFFHVNNPEGVTPAAHNVLDVDGRLAKIIETGEMAIINAVNACLKVAPVKILWVPGNHDPQTSYFLCRTIQAYFRLNPNVTVDTDPMPRKYFHFGTNLIGYTHGNEERHGDLPTIMAGECKALWGNVGYRAWRVGHRHKKAETRYSAADTYGGVVVQTIPSLSGTDAWHFKKGYVSGDRVAEASLYDFKHGLVATYITRNLRGVQ